MKDLYTLHVMPLIPGSEKELARDAEYLLKHKICTHIACCMTLVPETVPPADKAGTYSVIYKKFLSHFKGDKKHVGILIQASIGHGWKPNAPCNFQKILHGFNGEQYRMCPLGSDFLAYLDQQMDTLMSLKPGFFMVDDDFRMLTGHTGCFCPLHLAEFERRTGEKHTAESLRDKVASDEATARKYDEMILDSLLGAAKVIRGAIDRHDPDMECSFCICSGDVRHAGPVAKVLAGNGKAERIIRINNARYLTAEMRSFPRRMYDGALQIAALDDDIRILAETDTCPQTRWSTCATLMHSHYTGSILEGCRGAKHWITQMNTWNPEGGKEYRKILKKYNGFYQTLANVLDDAVPSCVIVAPLYQKPGFNNPVTANRETGVTYSWQQPMSVMGLPSNYSKYRKGLPAFFAEEDLALFTDEELTKFAENGIIVDGAAACVLTQRGLAHLIGVEARKWEKETISGEFYGKKLLKAGNFYYELTPLAGVKVEEKGQLFHRKSGTDFDPAVVGTALYFTEPAHGGRCAVFSVSMDLNGFNVFSLRDLIRKEQLVETLEYVTGGRISYVAGDNEVYMKEFTHKDGSRIMAFFNLAFDPMASLPLRLADVPEKIEALQPNGTWKEVAYKGGSVKEKLPPGYPMILRVTGIR